VDRDAQKRSRDSSTIAKSIHRFSLDGVIEGIRTGLRNSLRPFRGVHKKYLACYVAICEWAHNLKRVSRGFLQTIMGRFTFKPT